MKIIYQDKFFCAIVSRIYGEKNTTKWGQKRNTYGFIKIQRTMIFGVSCRTEIYASTDTTFTMSSYKSQGCMYWFHRKLGGGNSVLHQRTKRLVTLCWTRWSVPRFIGLPDCWPHGHRWTVLAWETKWPPVVLL